MKIRLMDKVTVNEYASDNLPQECSIGSAPNDTICGDAALMKNHVALSKQDGRITMTCNGPVYHLGRRVWGDVPLAEGDVFLLHEKERICLMTLPDDMVDQSISELQYYRRFTIGRGEGNSLRIISPFVSEQHITIFRKSLKSYWIRNEMRGNGTYVDGLFLTEERELSQEMDNTIIFGDVKAVFSKDTGRLTLTVPQWVSYEQTRPTSEDRLYVQQLQ